MNDAVRIFGYVCLIVVISCEVAFAVGLTLVRNMQLKRHLV